MSIAIKAFAWKRNWFEINSGIFGTRIDQND